MKRRGGTVDKGRVVLKVNINVKNYFLDPKKYWLSNQVKGKYRTREIRPNLN